MTTAAEPATVETVGSVIEATDDEVIAEVLVEEISIDGMCGVY
jgi:mycofactocin precursor